MYWEQLLLKIEQTILLQSYYANNVLCILTRSNAVLVWARHEPLWSFLFNFFFSLCTGATSFTVVMMKEISPHLKIRLLVKNINTQPPFTSRCLPFIYLLKYLHPFNIFLVASHCSDIKSTLVRAMHKKDLLGSSSLSKFVPVLTDLYHRHYLLSEITYL